MVEEVRRQFREIKGIMEYKAEPEYDKCVAISTSSALREVGDGMVHRGLVGHEQRDGDVYKRQLPTTPPRSTATRATTSWAPTSLASRSSPTP